MKRLLSDNEVGDRLHAAIETIGHARGQTARGDATLLGAVAALESLKDGLLIAAETGMERNPTLIYPLSHATRRNSGER